LNAARAAMSKFIAAITLNRVICRLVLSQYRHAAPACD
jgi:hypothetical protein